LPVTSAKWGWCPPLSPYDPPCSVSIASSAARRREESVRQRLSSTVLPIAGCRPVNWWKSEAASTRSVESAVQTAPADHGNPSTRASSPKTSPGPTVASGWSLSWLATICTSPSTTMNSDWPGSPLANTGCPLR